jgi:hypothetical protein
MMVKGKIRDRKPSGRGGRATIRYLGRQVVSVMSVAKDNPAYGFTCVFGFVQMDFHNWIFQSDIGFPATLLIPG